MELIAVKKVKKKKKKKKELIKWNDPIVCYSATLHLTTVKHGRKTSKVIFFFKDFS